jgi:hypothetical protein
MDGMCLTKCINLHVVLHYDSSVGIATGHMQEICLYSAASTPALRPSRYPSLCVQEALPRLLKRPELATHFHPVPRLRMVALNLHSHIDLHGVVLNQLNTRFEEWCLLGCYAVWLL